MPPCGVVPRIGLGCAQLLLCLRTVGAPRAARRRPGHRAHGGGLVEGILQRDRPDRSPAALGEPAGVPLGPRTVQLEHPRRRRQWLSRRCLRVELLWRRFPELYQQHYGRRRARRSHHGYRARNFSRGKLAGRSRPRHVCHWTIGSQIVDYVLWHKAHGVNIVAVSNSTGGGGIFTREDAEMLRDEGILMFVGRGNTPPTNRDSEIGDRTSWPFYHATPRWGIQEPAVHTIIPVTTDPEVWQTDYGVNSFYFGAPGTEEQSYAAPRAAALAAIAVEAYQEFPGHNGQSPTAQQIKRAM